MSNTAAQYGCLVLLALVAHLPCHGQTTTGTMEQAQSSGYPIEDPATKLSESSTSTVTVIASNLPIARVIGQMQDQTGIPIILKGSAGEEKVNVIVPKPRSIDEALSIIEASNPSLMIKQTKEAGTLAYEIWKVSEYEARAGVIRVYKLHEASADDVEDLVSPIITRNTGSIDADERLNKLIVYDVPEKQAEIEKLIRELDQPLTERFFTLRHRPASAMGLYLHQYCNLQPDQYIADDVSGQLAVRATTETLNRATRLIEAFDVPTEPAPDSKATTANQ